MSSQERANFLHLVADIAWFGLAVAISNRFLAFYAIRVGASPLEQGLIVSLPGLVMLFSTNLAGWWRRRYPDSSSATVWPGLLFRFIFCLPALTPFFPVDFQPIWLILSVSLPAIAQGVAAVIFIVLMREAVGEKQITRLNSRRTLALNAAILTGTIPFAIILENMSFPQNYQVVFLMAFLFTLISLVHVMKVRVLYPAPAPAPRKELSGTPLLKQRKFLSIAAVMVLSYMTFYSVFSVTPLHLVKSLGADEGFQAIFGTVELMAGIFAAMFVDRIIYRYGSKVSIVIGMTGISVAAVGFAMAPTMHFSLIGAAISGGSWTIALVSLLSHFMEQTPVEEATRWTTAYQQLVSVSTFVGPLIGSSLANMGVSLVIVLMIGAMLRFSAAMMIQFDVAGMLLTARSKRRALKQQLPAVSVKR